MIASKARKAADMLLHRVWPSTRQLLAAHSPTHAAAGNAAAGSPHCSAVAEEQACGLSIRAYGVNTNVRGQDIRTEGLSDGSSAAAATDTTDRPDRTADSASGFGADSGSTTSAAAAEEDAVCHPADPYCQAGEEAPRPDDFHKEGDGSTPPSAGFPA